MLAQSITNQCIRMTNDGGGGYDDEKKKITTACKTSDINILLFCGV